MPSTDQTHMLTPMAALLRDQGLKNDTVVQQVSLLVAWAWCYRHRPELNLPNPKDRPGITTAMQAMKKALEERGGAPTVDPDLLEMNCTGRAVQDLQDMVATLEWSDAENAVKALASLAEQLLGQQTSLPSLPLELAKLMVRLGRLTGQRVLAAYPMGDLPMALADEAAERTYASTSQSALSEALILISGATVVTYDHDASALHAEVVLSVPPMGVRVASPDDTVRPRHRRSEAIGLQEAYELAAHRAVVLIPAGILFDTTEYALREELVSSNALDMIIQLPGQTLLSTNIPPVLVVLDHQREQGTPITFVDASRLLSDNPRQRSKPSHQTPKFWDTLSQLVMNPAPGIACQRVGQGEIEHHDFDLSVNRYVMGTATKQISDLANTHPHHKIATLHEVAEIVRAQTLKGEEGEDGKRFIEIGSRDIDASGAISIEEPCKEVVVADRARRRAEQQLLRPGDVLLIGKGSTGRIALVGDDCGDNWIAGQVFLIIRAGARSAVRPEYLYRYLASPMVQQYLVEIASGTGISILKANDIKNLPVPVPSLEEQARVIDIHRQIMAEHEAIRMHQDKIEMLSQKYWAI